MIIHIVVLKLFIESNYWSSLSIATGVACLVLYYASVMVLSSDLVSEIIQPQLKGIFFEIFTHPKAWVCLVLIPLVALLPDMVWNLFFRLFYPTQTDAVMMIQKRDPTFEF